ncbi:MAG: hypothetical protein JHD16_16085 [Solirubrobacteraceae bacterium]|nr:hypothetical protein [Solirubrobacteraceae bacterium]
MSRLPSPRTGRRSRFAVLATCLTALAAAPAAHATSVYEPPNPLPPVEAGAVLKSQSSTLTLYGVPQSSWTRAWRVLYRSTALDGSPIAVSGLLAVPRYGNNAARPIVAMGHGTEGLGDQCAPSKQFTGGAGLESGTMYSLLKRGYAVMLSDGPGFGTPGDPTYIVGPAAGRALLDGVRAARQLSAAGLARDGRVGAFGYSEGGNTTAWANEIQADYAPDVQLAGSVAGGTPADLNAVAPNLNGSLFAAFLFAGAVGLNSAFPELDLPKYLNNAGRAGLAFGRGGCTLDVLPYFAFKKISDLTTSNPLEQPDWQARIASVRAAQQAGAAPLYVFHGTSDEILPYPQAAAMRERYCALGATVRFVTYRQTHFPTYASGAGSAFAWLAARLRGEPEAGNCEAPSPAPGA